MWTNLNINGLFFTFAVLIFCAGWFVSWVWSLIWPWLKSVIHAMTG
jgi:hypothetical protein